MSDEKKPDEGTKKPDEGAKKNEFVEETPVVTQHEVVLGGKTIKYSVTAGRMPLKNAKEEIEAQVFYMAYTKDDDRPAKERPLLISFNGGPGSSSVWLHLGTIGPKRAAQLPDGSLPPTYQGAWQTRSVHRSAERKPDDTATAVYADLWLSSESVTADTAKNN